MYSVMIYDNDRPFVRFSQHYWSIPNRRERFELFRNFINYFADNVSLNRALHPVLYRSQEVIFTSEKTYLMFLLKYS